MNGNNTQQFRYYRGFYAGPGNIAGMVINCPSCTKARNIHFRPDIQPSWEWDEDEVAPTVIPEIPCNNCGAVFALDSGETQIYSVGTDRKAADDR